MNEDQFEPRHRRYQMARECPCGKSNKDGKFSPFKGQEEGMAQYGKCHSCDQVFLPPIEQQTDQISSGTQKYIDKKILELSMGAYDQNSFYRYCTSLFPEYIVRQTFLSMFVGGSQDGSTVFWLVDSKGKICQPKQMHYQLDGKRDKAKPPMIPAQYKGAEGYYPCAFNVYNTAVQEEHIVAVVESEKTAVLCTMAFPDLDIVWISGGGATAMSGDKAHEIRERNTMIFYDADDAGREGAAKLDALLKKKKCRNVICDPFDDLTDGFDLADFIDQYIHDEDKMNWIRKWIQDKIDSFTSSEALDYESGIYSVRSNKDYLLHTFRHGKKKGETTHMEEFDENFKWKRTLLYTWTGYPNSGKSEVLLFTSLLKAKYDNWKWLLYVPESMSSTEEGMMTIDEVVDTLIWTYVGKSTDPENDNQMTEEEYLEAIDFIDEHYTFVYPRDDDATIVDLLAHFQYIKDTSDVKYDGIIIDPWNNLTEIKGNGELTDVLLSMQIKYVKNFAVKNHMVANIVVHPKAAPPNKDGEVPPANPFLLRGGPSFNNKSDVIVSIHRPDWFKETVDLYIDGRDEPISISGRNSTKVEFHTYKLKNQKALGAILGFSEWQFNRRTNRYENLKGLSPFDPAYRKMIDMTDNHQKVILEKPYDGRSEIPQKKIPF